jgi:hypothetical protein
MSYGENSLAPQAYYGSEAKMAQMPSLRQRLELAVKQAEEKLQAVREAKEIFDRNPDVERLLDIMQRSHF